MLITRPLRFLPEHLTRPRVGGFDVVTTLEHFAILTYTVDPEALALPPCALRTPRPARIGPFQGAAYPYSVMIQPRTEFTIYLPPRRLH